ncbi:TonB family protein [Halioxenophilus sp. WMMB6]|uniref:energy transducer TonB n=1 Tax=Halioxenophilus sp. WMMB6 TaxID=3073815 RepID=UPI00295EC918|nr:TonB family protein [Halioxenophilus sp. WMMB6]
MSTLTANFIPNNAPSRFGSVLPLAALFTFGLFALMQSLVATDDQLPDEPIYERIIDVVMPPMTVPDPIPYSKPEPTEVQQQPDTLIEQPTVTPDDNGLTTGKPVITGPTGGKGPTITFNSGALVKQVMVPPVYPRRALQNGIEGYVDVQFIVTAIGSTRDVQAVAAEPAGTFDSAAIKAVQAWRYRPIMVDGQGVDSDPITERIRFAIEH